ncbi:MAG: hypothetical protein AB7O50_11400 [Pseudolabrys sp.]
MTQPLLRLFEDVLAGPATAPMALPALPRVIYVVQGAAIIGGKRFAADEAWQGEDAVMLAAADEGTTCWRWELGRAGFTVTVAAAPGMTTREKLSALLTTLPKGELLMRCDSVSLPAGAVAYAHTHHGPGIRCVIDGGIRVVIHGLSNVYGPGCAWFEAGPDPVYGEASPHEDSRFIRVTILPLALAGQRSTTYVNPEDRDKAKLQQYKVYADAPIAFGTGG